MNIKHITASQSYIKQHIDKNMDNKQCKVVQYSLNVFFLHGVNLSRENLSHRLNAEF